MKRTGSGRVLVAVDGGMSDNPRPALYGGLPPVVAVNNATATVLIRRETDEDLLRRDVSD